MHGFRTHAIDGIGRHLIGLRQFIDIDHIGSSFNSSSHSIMVVLANEHDGQFPQHGQVEDLVQHSLTGGPISEKGEHSIVRALVFLRKGKACSRSDLRPYDAMSSEEFYIYPEKVHTASLPFRGASGFPI